MATRLAETLLASNTDMDRINRRVVRVGAVAAWTSAAVFLVAGFLSGEEALFIQSLGPILAAGFMTAQIIIGQENGGIALFAAAIVTIVMYTVTGDETTIIPAAVALVVICAIGMLLIESRQLVTVASVGFLLAFTPYLWGLPLGDAVQLGSVMALGFIMTSAIFFTIRNAATALNVRFQTLFEHSPTAMMEEDWSEAIAYVRSEYTGRPDLIRQFLLAYPAVVERAVSRARIVRVNQAAVDLLEANDPSELLGRRDGGRVTETTREAFVGALVALYEGKSLYESEVLYPTMKGNEIWLQTRSVDTSSLQAGTSVLVGIADVTHIKARQEAMSDLVKAKDEFIARVSHELRTPLTAVVGLTTEMNSMESLGDEERSELMQLVANQAIEMSHIVEDLLVAARAEMGTVAIDTTFVDLGAELSSTVESLGIPVAELPDAIPDVVADANRVRQILRNLLTNAQRYGGPNRRVLAGVVHDMAWLEVRDDGEGVPEGLADAIFEPYATAHKGVKGSVGLGLSVARQLAELMGGSLAYERDLDETVFRLELPVASKRRSVLASNSARF